ncbi:MAG: cell surface protein SprA [bacterium]
MNGRPAKSLRYIGFLQLSKPSCGVIPLVILILLSNLLVVGSIEASAFDSLSVQFALKITGAYDLHTWKQPFSFNKFLLSDTTAAILKTEAQYFKVLTEIDSSYQTVKIRHLLSDDDWLQPVVFSMEEYIQFRLRIDPIVQFRDNCIKALETSKTGAGEEGLTIEIPFKIKSKTFNKIFGGDRVRLRISGNINIQGGFRREDRSQVATVTGQDTDYSFHIDQTQQFKITGEVGDKVSVQVDQDSERMFEFENALKLTYTGYEDEIIQKIEAGNISMQLQGAQLATFSGQNKGLFGLKSEMKIGPLSLTTIASLEKGEKNKLTVAGGAQQTTANVSVNSPQTGRYFFLDRRFREQYKIFDTSGGHIAKSNLMLDPDNINVYKTYTLGAGSLEAGIIQAWAIYNTAADSAGDPTFWQNADVDSTDKNHQSGYFRLLDRSEYFVNTQLGYIRLNTPVSTNDILAVSYKMQDGPIFGDLITYASADSVNILKLIKPSSPLPYDDTWPLAWRNVYSLGGVSIEKEGFVLRITYSPSGALELETIADNTGTQQTFLTMFGLDTKSDNGSVPDGKIDDNPALINWNYGELIFPDLQPFDPEGYYINDTSTPALYWGDPADFPDTLEFPAIYDSTQIYPSNFNIKAEYKSVKAVYELGFNILEGSEEVYLNGAQLQKGSDYVIDYYSGSLTVLKESALSPSANLEIVYESGELFQLDKKTLLGVRGEYHLWDQSFIGAMALYLNEKPLQDRVKVGSEPLRNFLWDVNSRLIFKPQFLTSAVDWLPLIETEAPSELKVEMEYAQVHPNPNSLDNPGTGDYDGVAYVDDFESIKKTSPLGIMRRQWTMSSDPIPVDSLKNRGTFVWFNPYEQVAISEIWPDRPTNANVAQRAHVLTMYFSPILPRSGYEYNKEDSLASSWGGVIRSLSAGYHNQEKSKYIEIKLKVVDKGQTPGKLHIDLGQISEDVIPNTELDTEDIPLPGLPYGNGFLDSGEDVGLDGMAGNDPTDFWDLDEDGLKTDNEPISQDDWGYTPNNTNDVWRINGTEGNQNDEGGRYPDTEDLDKDNFLDLANNYFRYTIDLSETTPGLPDEFQPGSSWTTNFLVESPNNNDWKLYRIPLDAWISKMNSPSLTQVEYVRVWMDGFTTTDTFEVSLASLEIVGNEWQSIPVLDAVGVSYEPISIEVVNTYDNPDYNSPPGVAGWQDPVTNIISQEQSLRLVINEIAQNDTGVVFRRLYETQDYLEYKKLKMFVHGGGFDDAENTLKFNEENEIWMFFRFGTDTTRNYYEYKQRVWANWDPAERRNDIEISFDLLSELKRSRAAPINQDSVYSMPLPGGDTLSVKGTPSLSQVRQFTAGIIPRAGPADGLEIWLDELRVSDVKKDIGRAARASVNLTLADLMTVNANLNAQDGNFHNINTRVGTRADSYNGAATGSFQLHKLLNPQWGLSVPITGNFSQQESIPYYFSNSDVLVDRDNPEQVDTVKTYSQTLGGGIDVAKTIPSTSPWLAYTVDKMSGGYDYAYHESTGPSTEFASSTSHTANVGYNLTFGRPSLAFLTWLGGVPLLKKYSDARLYWLITKMNLSLTGTESYSRTYYRTGINQGSHTYYLTKGFSTGLRPFESLTFDYSRSHKADLLMKEETPKDISNILQGDLGWSEDMDASQTLTASYTPQLFSWLDTDSRYNTTYHWGWGPGYYVNGQTISNNNSISGSLNFKLTQILKKPVRPTTGKQTQPTLPPGAPDPSGKSSGMEQQPDYPDTQEPTGLNSTSQEQGEEGSVVPDSLIVPGDSTQVDTTQRELPVIEKPKKPSAPAELWYALRYLVTRLRDVRLDYTQTNGWSDPLVSGQAGLGYQFGFDSHDYGRIASAASFTGFPSRSRSDDYSLKSGLDFTKNLKMSLSHSYRWSRSESQSVNGTITQSRLYFFKTSGDSIGVFEIPIPEWTLTWTGLEKFALFEKLAKTVSLDHSFTGSRTTTWNDQQDNVTKHDYTRNFSPLVGLNITWNKGITSNIRYNWTETGSVVKIPTPAKSRTRQSNASVTVSYSMKTGFRIPIPIWPFKNKRFSNNTTIGLNLSYSSSHTENEALGKFIETNFTNNWSIKPSLDYTFSNTVTGGMHFEYGSNKSKLSESNFQEFGLTVNITIRG